MENGRNCGTGSVSHSSLFLASLPYVKKILDFRQDEKETLGIAWARFSQLTHAGPDLSIPDHVLL